MLITKSARSAGKPVVGVGISFDGGIEKFQNGVLDLNLENEVKVYRSRNFNWPCLCHLSTHNQNV